MIKEVSSNMDIKDFNIYYSVLGQMGFPGSSAGKEFTCKAEHPGLIPGSGRSPGEGIGYPLQYSWASMVAQLVKKSACNVGDWGSIPGLGRFPGGGHGNPLQQFCLENPHEQGSLLLLLSRFSRVRLGATL